MSNDFGYLLVHFVESDDADGEQIHFSLSDGDDPLRWTRLAGGAPVLRSSVGTTGVRDPQLVRGDGEFFLVATDLRVHGDGAVDWNAATRTASRSIVVWRSTDLVTWSEPWLAEVAPESAGMAWAPEALYDSSTGGFDVFWSSALYEPSDPDHSGESYSRILVSRTMDFHRFGEPEVLIDRGGSVIDLTMVREGARVHRFAKDGPEWGAGLMVYHESGSGVRSDDFVLRGSGLGSEISRRVEGPLVFRDHRTRIWYLWVDRYDDIPGYIALRGGTELVASEWSPVPSGEFRLPPQTKHGGVLPLQGDEWERLVAAFPPRPHRARDDERTA